jgi:tRNA(Ile)-lysidine synthase
MGHTADDVAESELIRQQTPTHGRLAEWAPSPVWPEGRGVFLLRPLLGVRRAALRAALQAEGIGWLEDPANDDLRYARSRARRTLALPLERERLGDRGDDPGDPGVSSDRHGDGIAEEAGAGLLTLERRRPIAIGLLAKALLCVGGGERPPPGRALARLQLLAAAGERFVQTLAGVRVEASAAAVQLTRELGRRPPPALALAPGAPVIFDGRFEIRAYAAGWRVAPLAGRAAALPRAERETLRAMPAAARPSLPVLTSPAGVSRLPAPFGEGPATACSLVADRLTAALGRIGDERTLATQSSVRPHGVTSPVVLS